MSGRWTENEVMVLKKNYGKNLIDEMIKLLPQRNKDAIKMKASHLKIRADRYYWSEKEIQILKENYGKKKIETWKNLLPNRKRKDICCKAARLNIKGNHSLAIRKYEYNKQYFLIPNVENSYYAGFIAGDSHLKIEEVNNHLHWSLCTQLSSKDKVLLEYFKEDIEFTGPILDRTRIDKRPNVLQDKYYSSSLNLHGAKQIIDDLEKNWNITTNKSLVLNPPNVRDNIALSYIIGIIDSDGHIVLVNGRLIIGMLGTKALLEWIRLCFNKLILYPNEKYPKINNKDHNPHLYSIYYSGKRAQQIAEHLLTIQTPFKLSRKWNKIYDSKFCTI